METGKHLGAYEILGPLGAGGMGEVYRARDPRLERDVAIKVLPADFATDPERLARFEREAKLLAQLNHPHIAGIYGLEEADGTLFIAMECVEGATLAEKIEAEGRVEVEEALEIARQIAEALEAAHEAGIVHRDLKPANVKVTDEGTVKVLDFGLAKGFGADGSASEISPDLSASPTVAAATRTGVIMGTAAYMSPEQARGKKLDKRTDIWAFGCVLYEMLAGARPFQGETVSDVMAAILKEEPDWDRLPVAATGMVLALLRMCMEKDSRGRIRDIGDARIVLTGGFNGLQTPANDTLAATRRPWQRPLGGAALIAGIVAVTAFATWSATRSGGGNVGVRTPTVHIPVAMPPGVELPHDQRATGVSIAPQGRLIAFVGETARGRYLYLLDLDDPGPAMQLRGTEDAGSPAFSNDGKWLAFTARGALWKVGVEGEAAVRIADAPDPRGIAWGVEDRNLFLVPEVTGGIWSVSPTGTDLERVTTLSSDRFEFGHRWPEVLPDGRLLYTVDPGNEIVVSDPSSNDTDVLPVTGLYARYAPTSEGSGHLVYAQTDALWAAPINLRDLSLGTPVKVAEGILTNFELHAEYDFSASGTLVYQTGVSDFGRRLVRRGRDGALRPLDLNAHPDSSGFRISPDGRRLAVTFLGNPDGQMRSVLSEEDVFIYEFDTGKMERLTDEPSGAFNPVWTRDGRSIVYSVVRQGLLDLAILNIDRSEPRRILLESPAPKWPGSWHPDGLRLAFTTGTASRRNDIWIYSTSETPEVEPFLDTVFEESSPAFSPDGNWLAFETDETGTFEVRAVRFPGRELTCTISSGGGRSPRWSADGREFFYQQGTRAMVASVPDTGPCEARSAVLFEGLDGRASPWDVAPSGDFFITLDPRDPPRLHIALDWFGHLRRVAPSEDP